MTNNVLKMKLNSWCHNGEIKTTIRNRYSKCSNLFKNIHEKQGVTRKLYNFF